MEEWLLWCITCQTYVLLHMAEMGQVEVPVLPMYSVQPFRNGSVFEDFSVSKRVVGSIMMSLHSRVVLGSKLHGAGETYSLDWRNP